MYINASTGCKLQYYETNQSSYIKRSYRGTLIHDAKLNSLIYDRKELEKYNMYIFEYKA